MAIRVSSLYNQTETNELTETSTGCLNLLPGISIVEMHTFLVTLVRQFDFSLPDNGQEVRVVRLGLIRPVVVGEEHKGQQVPLKVTAVLGSE